LVSRHDDVPASHADDGRLARWSEEAPVRIVRACRRLCALLVCCLLAATGCGLGHLQDLNFRVDHRLHFLSPKDRSTVRQPVTISWRIDDFRIAAAGSEPPSRHAGYFAVFVDRAPIKPGQTLKALGNGDPTCDHDPASCLTKSYLQGERVFTTTAMTLKFPLIPDLTGDREKLQLHAITIVLLDTSGHRIGESAWELDIRLHKLGTV
jgi:hypothetical protein